MLLESRLSDDTVLFVDCETTSGFDKSDSTGDFHPDDAIKNVCRIAGQVACELGTAARTAAAGSTAPQGLEMEFALKVDSRACVSVARAPSEGQFKVRIRWGR